MKKMLQERGQFCVKHIGGDAPDVVPVDNFVFIEVDRDLYQFEDGIWNTPNEVKLETHSGEASLNWKKRKSSKYETYLSTAEALRRMADVLDGTVAYKDFGKIQIPLMTLRDWNPGELDAMLAKEELESRRKSEKNKQFAKDKKVRQMQALLEQISKLRAELEEDEDPWS